MCIHLWLSLQKCFQVLHSAMFGLGIQSCVDCSVDYCTFVGDILAQGLLFMATSSND